MNDFDQISEREKRWSTSARNFVHNARIDAFLDEVVAVCRKHGMSISHEDGAGAFVIIPFSENAVAWLEAATDDTTRTP